MHEREEFLGRLEVILGVITALVMSAAGWAWELPWWSWTPGIAFAIWVIWRRL